MSDNWTIDRLVALHDLVQFCLTSIREIDGRLRNIENYVKEDKENG